MNARITPPAIFEVIRAAYVNGNKNAKMTREEKVALAENIKMMVENAAREMHAAQLAAFHEKGEMDVGPVPGEVLLAKMRDEVIAEMRTYEAKKSMNTERKMRQSRKSRKSNRKQRKNRTSRRRH